MEIDRIPRYNIQLVPQKLDERLLLRRLVWPFRFIANHVRLDEHPKVLLRALVFIIDANEETSL